MPLDPGSPRPCTVDGIVARYKDDRGFAAALARPLSAQDDLHAQMVISEMRINRARHEPELADLTKRLQEAGAPPAALSRARAYYSAHCLPSPPGSISPLSQKAGETVRNWALW